MKISFDNSITQNFEKAIRREWIETNGLGGWSSSTIIGANTRRYHGLLVAATRPPVERKVLLSKLDETIDIADQRIELGTNVYSGSIHPEGYRYVHEFTKDFFPVLTYETAGVRLQKTIAAVNGENTTLVIYKVLKAPHQFNLELMPFVSGRDYHSLMHVNDAISHTYQQNDDILRVQPYEGLPGFFIRVPGATFETNPDWYYNFEYSVEKSRGQDFKEDLFTYGVFKCSLKSGDKFGVIVSTRNPIDCNAFSLFEKEKLRRQKLLSNVKTKTDISSVLMLAADQFVVQRGDDLKTVIAGYHWFADWGRDTMISLPGITLATGRFDDAKKILRAFAQSTSQGMLPNRFSDSSEEIEYNTVDATLWFFVAIYKYLKYTGDKKFVRE